MEKDVKHEQEIAVTLLRSLAGKIAKESWKTHNPAGTGSIVQVGSYFFISDVIRNPCQGRDLITVRLFEPGQRRTKLTNQNVN